MKRLLLHNIATAFLILFFSPSCNPIKIQDTDYVELNGLYKLVETISSGGFIIENDETMAPLVSRKWYGWTKTQPQQRIDSLFLLKNIDGELIEKFAIIDLISYNQRIQRSEYLLSNGKYIYIECDHYLNFFVSEIVDTPLELKKELKRGKYINLHEKPGN